MYLDWSFTCSKYLLYFVNLHVHLYSFSKLTFHPTPGRLCSTTLIYAFTHALILLVTQTIVNDAKCESGVNRMTHFLNTSYYFPLWQWPQFYTFYTYLFSNWLHNVIILHLCNLVNPTDWENHLCIIIWNWVFSLSRLGGLEALNYWIQHLPWLQRSTLPKVSHILHSHWDGIHFFFFGFYLCIYLFWHLYTMCWMFLLNLILYPLLWFHVNHFTRIL